MKYLNFDIRRSFSPPSRQQPDNDILHGVLFFSSPFENTSEKHSCIVFAEIIEIFFQFSNFEKKKRETSNFAR